MPPPPSNQDLIHADDAQLMSAQERAWLSLTPAPRPLTKALTLHLSLSGVSTSHRAFIVAMWCVMSSMSFMVYELVNRPLQADAILIPAGELSVCFPVSIAFSLVVYAVAAPLLLSGQARYRTLLHAAIMMRRVVSIEPGHLGDRVEIEEERGTSWLRLPRSQVRAHEIKRGDLIPIMRSDDGRIMSPLELRALTITPQGQLAVRLEASSYLVLLIGPLIGFLLYKIFA